ncbi:hypothetical protein EVAR_4511_1 [Eumeta japonica]|uniref:Uncharacterized protein n=1 Tax=Eumeta variegata TaxID=151549 RepID=A0A4C1SYK3_EUMVA|nr:hypothetical protein EVAR_4511_1 [Eumeta japonica]
MSKFLRDVVLGGPRPCAPAAPRPSVNGNSCASMMCRNPPTPGSRGEWTTGTLTHWTRYATVKAVTLRPYSDEIALLTAARPRGNLQLGALTSALLRVNRNHPVSTIVVLVPPVTAAPHDVANISYKSAGVDQRIKKKKRESGLKKLRNR